MDTPDRKRKRLMRPWQGGPASGEEGQKLPCYVKVAVYQSGLAAPWDQGRGPPEDDAAPPRRGKHSTDPVTLRARIDEEIGRQGVSSGVKEEEIRAAVDGFVKAVRSGSDAMVSGRSQRGSLPSRVRTGAWSTPSTRTPALLAMGRDAKAKSPAPSTR